MARSADLFELMRTNGQRMDKAEQGYWERFIEEFGADRVIRAYKEFIGREDYSGREVQQHELRPLLTRYKRDGGGKSQGGRSGDKSRGAAQGLLRETEGPGQTDLLRRMG